MIEDNGILASVPGQSIAAALESLPPAATTEADQIVEIKADHIGPVRIDVIRRKAKHGKHSHWYWAAYRAEAVA